MIIILEVNKTVVEGQRKQAAGISSATKKKGALSR